MSTKYLTGDDKMTLEDVREHYVTLANAMRKLELGANSYQYWKVRGSIPIFRQRLIEMQTKGKLKADS